MYNIPLYCAWRARRSPRCWWSSRGTGWAGSRWGSPAARARAHPRTPTTSPTTAPPHTRTQRCGATWNSNMLPLKQFFKDLGVYDHISIRDAIVEERAAM